MADPNRKVEVCRCHPTIRAMRFLGPGQPIWICEKCSGRPIWAVGRVTIRGRTQTALVVFVGIDDPRNRIEDFEGGVLLRNEGEVRRQFAWYYGLQPADLSVYFQGVDTSAVLDVSVVAG